MTQELEEWIEQNVQAESTPHEGFYWKYGAKAMAKHLEEQNRKVTYESLLEGLPKNVEYKGDVYTLSLEIQQDGDENLFCLFYSCGYKFLMIPDNSDIDLNCAKNNVLKWLNENKQEIKTFEP